MLIRNEIEQMVDKLRARHEYIVSLIGDGPSGRLFHTLHRGKRLYYEVPDGKTVKAKRRIKEPVGLMRKMFLQAELKLLEENLALVEMLLKGYKQESRENILGMMRHRDAEVLRQFPEASTPVATDEANVIGPMHNPLQISQEQYERIRSREEWANQPYQANQAYSKYKNKKTSRGLLVRSKAEVLIAEKLYEYGIPFRYAMLIECGDKEAAPDFTFLDAQGQPFYLEYFGMMGDLDYISKFKYKRNLYEHSGIKEWENLICIFDKNNEIDMEYVEQIIRLLIIPRL